MIRVPRSQSTTVKNIIYPESKKAVKNFHVSNIHALKKQQQENKHKKEEKENNIPPEPFKMKEFKNVESRLGKILSSGELINNYNTERGQKNTFVNSNKNTLSNMLKTKTLNKDMSNSTGLLKVKKNGKNEISKKVNNKEAEVNNDLNDIINNYNNRKSEEAEENIYAVGKIEEGLREEFMDLKKMLIKNTNQVENPIKKHLKGPTPRANETNVLAPKIHKDHITENRQKVIQNELPSKVVKKEEAESNIHRNFGKTPDYLKKFKQEAEDKKENE